MAERALMATHDVGDRVELPGGFWLEKRGDDKWTIGQSIDWCLEIRAWGGIGKDGSIDNQIDEFAKAMNGTPTDG